jgi:hypothetical protein
LLIDTGSAKGEDERKGIAVVNVHRNSTHQEAKPFEQSRSASARIKEKVMQDKLVVTL